jgi:thioredoxin reductase/SAM-dependent methyltransferase
MTNHDNHTAVRHCDVAVVGGSAAGLAAALQIGRQRRSVIVIDAGEPRNAPAAHMHSYLGHEGLPPSELSAIGREEVRSYGGEVVPGRVLDVTRTDDDRFRLELVGGHTVYARRVLAATGLVDELPDIEGVAEHWGRDVIHCPFCHGFEVRDQQIVQIITSPMGFHPAAMFRQLSTELTLVLHDGVAPDAPEVEAMRAAGVRVVDDRVRRVVAGDDGRITRVELEDGDPIAADAVVVGTRFRVRAEPFQTLGLTLVDHASGLGQVVETDPTGATSVPGLYAAGNVTDPSQQVLGAAANGSWIGAMISAHLAHDDIAAAARPSANETDWDHRYSGEQLWSGNPNGTLVDQIGGRAPGRALDVGAGEGGDAIWLAEQGWAVTASDISRRALDRIAAEADRRSLPVAYLRADANGREVFERGAFDLVSAQYASIPRTPDRRGVENLLAAVAPGGTLLVVGHDLEPMRAAIDTREQSRPFDPDAYVRTDDVAAALTDDPDWTIELHERRPRPSGSATGHHHIDDVVLRARRAG